VDLALLVHKKGQFHVRLRIRWLLGVFQKRLVPGAQPKPVKPEKPETPKAERGPTRWPRYLLAAIRTEGLIPLVLKLVPQLLGNLRIRDLALDLRVGLDDPALTGEFYGSLCTVLVPMRALPGSCVSVVPDFDGMVLDGELETEIRVVPASLLGTVLAFAVSPPFLRAGGAVLRERFR
jgi:hypothetical protein